VAVRFTFAFPAALAPRSPFYRSQGSARGPSRDGQAGPAVRRADRRRLWRWRERRERGRREGLSFVFFLLGSARDRGRGARRPVRAYRQARAGVPGELLADWRWMFFFLNRERERERSGRGRPERKKLTFSTSKNLEKKKTTNRTSTLAFTRCSRLRPWARGTGRSSSRCWMPRWRRGWFVFRVFVLGERKRERKKKMKEKLTRRNKKKRFRKKKNFLLPLRSPPTPQPPSPRSSPASPSTPLPPAPCCA